MELYLDDTTTNLGSPHDFVFSFEVPENLSAFSIADNAYLTIQTILKLYENSNLKNRKPIILNLRGFLTHEEYIGLGGELIAVDNLPPFAFALHHELSVNLTFKFSLSYIAYLEDQRVKRGAKNDIFLYPHLEALIQVNQDPKADPILEKDYDYSLVKTSNTERPKIRIARSDWLDRFLSGFGYKVAQTLQLPDIEAAGFPVELLPAIEHLTAARQLFLHEDYRAAINRCRQAKDALLGSNPTSWSQTNLTPILGKEKTAMIDESIKALNNLGNAASHGANTVEIDRESSEFVLNALLIILNYISKKFR